MYKILIFGTGGLCSVIKEYIDYDRAEIIAYVNSDPALSGKLLDNKQIIFPTAIKNYEYDYVIIASGSYDLVKEQLIDVEVPTEKIIGFKMNESNIFSELEKGLNEQLARYTNAEKFHLFSNKSLESVFICNMPLLGRERSITIHDDKSIDYIRLSTLELIANEINFKNIEGNVAELGVYKGDFAKHINVLFPNRSLYLFDTFEGFDSRDVVVDLRENFIGNETNSFADTDVKFVMDKMMYPKQCIIKKGYFPESATGLEDKFAFVSIDTDLYNPIFEGLSYFYPRLVPGGYIFVHDYNNSIFRGSKSAVREFCAKHQIPYVPVSDALGTVIIAK